MKRYRSVTPQKTGGLVAGSLARAIILCLVSALMGGPGFAEEPAYKVPGPALPESREYPLTYRDTGEGQYKAEEKYENDASVEKILVGVTIEGIWHEDAAYVNRQSSDSTQWEWNIEYGGHFTTKIYKLPRHFLEPPKIVIPKTAFTLYAKKATGATLRQDQGRRVVSSDIRFMMTPSNAAGTESSVDSITDSFFKMDLSLSGGMVTPVAGSSQMAVMTPFMTMMSPNGALKLASMNVAQILTDTAATIKQLGQTYFKVPVTVQPFSINKLKEGPVTLRVSEGTTGPGLMGGTPGVSGQIHCGYDMTVVVYLKQDEDGGYDPNKNDRSYVPDGRGTIGKKGGSDPETKPPADKKRPGPLSREHVGPENAGADPAQLAKAVRILNRTLHDMEIPKNAGNFTGLDYKDLAPAKKRGLLYYFIDEAKPEGVTILKGAPFYFNQLEETYDHHPDRSSGTFLDVLMEKILGENDWRET